MAARASDGDEGVLEASAYGPCKVEFHREGRSEIQERGRQLAQFEVIHTARVLKKGQK